MKSGQNYSNNRQRRPRRVSNNNNRKQYGNNPNRHWESLGPNVRIRGSASQIYDKYIGMAEDAKRNGDRVLVENLKQHAEHYLRIMNQQQAQRLERQAQQAQQQQQSEELANEAEETEAEENNNDDATVEDLTPKVEAEAPTMDTDDADAAAMN